MERIFRFPIKVGKESIDVLGHTNNKEYLRWMEEAALAHSDSLGWTMDRYLGIGKVFVASTHKIEYLRPTFEGDELTMLTWVETMDGAKSRRCFYQISKHQAFEEVLRRHDLVSLGGFGCLYSFSA